MKNIEQKEKFIELRAKGFSFEKISKELNVSKPTLIKWQNEFKKEISNREFLNYQEIIEKHKLSKPTKVEILSSLLEKIWEEIEKKDLTGVGIKDLVRIKGELQTELNFATFGIQYQTGEHEEINFETKHEKTIKL